VIELHEDDLAGDDVRALLRLHLEGMHAASPPGTVFALDLSGLRAPGIAVWTARRAGALAGIGALKVHADGVGELKSMRTHPDHLRRGVAAALLDHLVAEAGRRGCRRVSLETGSGPAFEPALALYRGRGFVEGDAFADYRPGAFSRFFHRPLGGR
jgi:putative acetyltransferase